MANKDRIILYLIFVGFSNKLVNTKEAGKFGKNGMLKTGDLRQLGLEEETAQRLAEMGNMGLAKSTWSNYKTAEKMLIRCEEETGKEMKLPLDQERILTYIDWLINRGVKHGTICSYLSGIRQLHLTKGYTNTIIRTELVNLILAGKKNKDVLEKEDNNRKGRLPVTVNVMKLIKAELRDSKMVTEEKLLVWAVSCIAFNGAFRIHELLCREEGKYDSRTTLLEKDIKLIRDKESGKQVLLIWLKWPKEDRAGKGIEVEVFETESEICPVRAIKKWWKCTKIREKEQPAFRTPDGLGMTGRKLNRILSELLEKHFDYDEGKITTHSFRSGVTTTLGKLGFSDEELQQVGRWSSRAFEHYVKLPRTRRREIALQIGKL